MMTFKTLIPCLCVAAVVGCGSPSPNNTTVSSSVANKPNTNANANSAANTGASNAATSNTSTGTTSSLKSLNASVGKTASDIKLWENKDVNPRLEKLLGPDYANMKKFWNTESPISAEGDVLMMSGCEQHNCGDNQYVMFIDTSNDNINVVHIKNGKTKDYKEKGDISLPKRFADELDARKQN